MASNIQLTDKECMNLILGTLRICANDRELGYVSAVSPEYSHLKDDGEKMLLNTLRIVFPSIIANESKRVEEIMHERLLKELK